MSRHEPRQRLALEFGATDIVEQRGDDGVARIKDLTNGLGAHSVIEAVGNQESMMQAIRATRPGGHVGYVGVAHDVELPGDELFFSHVHLHGGPAPVRRFLPELIDLIWNRTIDPGKVFDLTLPLDEAAEGYRAMDERCATKPAQPRPSPLQWQRQRASFSRWRSTSPSGTASPSTTTPAYAVAERRRSSRASSASTSSTSRATATRHAASSPTLLRHPRPQTS